GRVSGGGRDAAAVAAGGIFARDGGGDERRRAGLPHADGGGGGVDRRKCDRPIDADRARGVRECRHRLPGGRGGAAADGGRGGGARAGELHVRAAIGTDDRAL